MQVASTIPLADALAVAAAIHGNAPTVVVSTSAQPLTIGVHPAGGGNVRYCFVPHPDGKLTKMLAQNRLKRWADGNYSPYALQAQGGDQLTWICSDPQWGLIVNGVLTRPSSAVA